MSTATLNSRIAGQFFADAAVTGVGSAQFERGTTESGSPQLRVKGLPIFRSGEFEDSMGERTAFDQFSIESIVRNFDYLKSSRIFERPVVRAGHPNTFNNGRLESVIGYIEDIRSENREAPHDHKEYTYIISDLLILDADAITKIESGLYFNRSAEIGPHRDNTGNMVAPCMMGVAYVDIPAVEGLDAYESVQGQGLFFSKAKDDAMSGSTLPPSLFTFKIGGNDTTDFNRVQGYISQVESDLAEAQANFERVKAESVQKDAELTTLREFKSNLEKTAKSDYVNKLIESGRIMASSKDDVLALFESYTDEQFESAKKVYDAIPTRKLFQNHGVQHEAGNDNASPAMQEYGAEVKRKLENDKGIVRQLKMMGKSEDVIKKTPAYQAILAVEPDFSLAK